MMSNNNHVLKVGDWVRGISNEGELIVGYIVCTLKSLNFKIPH